MCMVGRDRQGRDNSFGMYRYALTLNVSLRQDVFLLGNSLVEFTVFDFFDKAIAPRRYFVSEPRYNEIYRQRYNKSGE